MRLCSGRFSISVNSAASQNVEEDRFSLDDLPLWIVRRIEPTKDQT